jgi:putative membrane-bound dehydrogenase-like protein
MAMISTYAAAAEPADAHAGAPAVARTLEAEHGVVCRLPGERFGYFGWPTVARTDDGRLLVVSSGLRSEHVCPFGKTVLHESKDDGRTWSASRVIQDSPIDDRDAGILNLGGNSLLVSWFRSDTRKYADEDWIPAAERESWKQIFAGWSDEVVEPLIGSWVMRSDDGGTTWGAPVRAPVSAPHGPILLRGGDLLYLGKPFGTWDEMGAGQIAAARSSDGGATWKIVGRVPVAPRTDAAHYHEPHVVELPSGRLVAALRLDDAPGKPMSAAGIPHFTIMQTESSDGGATWSMPCWLGFKGSPPHLLRHSSGALVMSYGYRSKPFGQRVAISRDDGRTWDADWILRGSDPVDLGYPSTVELADGSLLTVYYQQAGKDEKCSLLWSKWRLPAAEPSEPVAIGSRRELFVDRLLIDRLDGATLKLHEPVSGGTAIRIDKPWEGPANGGMSVIELDGRLLMYYRGWSLADQADENGVGCVAESRDGGATWTKPSLDLVERADWPATNIIATVAGEPRFAFPCAPWVDTRPGVPASERVKMIESVPVSGEKHSAMRDPAGPKRLVFWASADGFSFRKLDPQPDFVSDLRNSFDGGNTMFWSEAEGQYVLYYRWYDGEWGKGRRSMARTTSKDLMTWTKPVPMTYDGSPREQFYVNNTQPYFRAPHLFVAPAARFMEGRQVLDEERARGIGVKTIGKHAYFKDCSDGVLLTSRAGSTAYDRMFMETFVRPGLGDSNWVSRTNYPLTGILPAGSGHMQLFVARNYMQPTWHVERLLLRTDGFASVSAPWAGGEMLTKPLTFAGDALEINYRTGAAGSVRVEITDADGTPLAGFAAADCEEIIGDEIERVVAWKTGSDVTSLAGTPVRLRFILADADVFSFRFRPPPRPDDAPRPRSPAESLETFRVPAGLKVQLVAAEPLIQQPSGICWDAQGRLYVSELHGYNLEGQFDIEELNKTGQLDTEVRRVAASAEAQAKAAAETFGVVKRLSDTDGDGRMDRATVFADTLPACYGICAARDGIIVTAAPQIIFLADRDGDGVAEVREVLFEGFETGVFERNVNQPQWGHDDWIYVGAGAGGGRITGPHLAEPVDLPAADFRFKADGSALEPLVGRTHTFGLTLTDRGEKIVSNTTVAGILTAPIPWGALARNPDSAIGSVEYPLGGNRAYPRSAPHPWRTKREANAEFATFYKDRYGIAESAASGYFTSGCGPLFYDDTALPGLTGQLFACEPSQNLISRGLLGRDNGRLTLTRLAEEAESEFCTSTDGWFHAIALAHAPDGGIAVVDFYREIIEDYSAIPRYLQQQYELDHGKDRGRIWKIVPDEPLPVAAADMNGLSADALVRELASERFWRRQTARRLLVERKATAAAAAIATLVTPAASRPAVVNALHTMAALDASDPAAIWTALTHADPAVRIHAVAVAEPLLAGDRGLRDAVFGLAADPDADVVRRVTVALGAADDPRTLDALASIARRSGDVPWMDAAVMSSLAGRAGQMLAMLLAEPAQIGKAGPLVGSLAAAVAARREPAELSATITAVAAAEERGLRGAAWQGLRKAFHAPVDVRLDPAAITAVRMAQDDADAAVATAARDLVRLLKIESQEERSRRIAALAKNVGDPEAAPEARLAAVRKLSAESDPAVTQSLIASFEWATPQVREAILEACFARAERLPAVVDALEAGALPASACSALHRAALEEHADAALATRAHAQFAKLLANLDGQLAEYSRALSNPRDRARGGALFTQHCGSCHQAHGVGLAVGPALAGEAKQPEETLLVSILAPSVQITGGYTTYTLLTTGGQVFTGLLAADTASSVTLKQQEGKTQTVLRRDIEELKASPVSLMPESLGKVLSPQDVADILAWLRDPEAK